MAPKAEDVISEVFPGCHSERSPVIPKNTDSAPFTIGDIRKSIPKDCFEPTLQESFSHLARDLLEMVIYTVTILAFDHFVQSTPLKVMGWLLYTWLQGVTGTGIWVIAHECGHGAFSKSTLINDSVGFVLHSFLLVPYFSWQRSHSNHHHFTNNLQKDEVFVPKRLGKQHKSSQSTTTSPSHPIVALFNLITMLIFGWPLYLLVNATSHKTDRFASHFLPSSEIFKKTDYFKVVLSNAGLIAVVACLYQLGMTIGFGMVAKLYLMPLLVVNAFLVAITFLQHTDKKIPHYDNEEWHWLRGALCTVDRTMGPWLDRKLHYIHYTHVCHHIFSRIPFYRSIEATKHIKSVIGDYYTFDSSNFAVALYENSRKLNYLEEGTGILYWAEDAF